MTAKGVNGALLGAAAAAMLLVAPAAPARTVPEPKVKIDRKKAKRIGFFAPAAADAHQTALFDHVGGGFDDPSFRFTPSGSGSRRAVTVAIRARSNHAPAGPALMVSTSPVGAGLAPTAYSLGASVGWKRFALSGDFAHIDGGTVPDSRDLADIGVSYSGTRWSTRLLFGAERATSKTSLGGPEQALSVDLGGSYSLTRNLQLSGGVRYKTQRDRFDLSSDDRRDSQAIYIGTAFKF